MKKFVSMLVVLAMVLSMVPTVFAAETVLSGTVEAASGKTYTTETWTAEANGVLTISLSSDKGLGYKTYINGECQSLGWEGFCLSTEVSYNVTEEDQIYLELAGKTTSWGDTNSNITYSFSFSADGVVKEAYSISEQTITAAGSHSVTMIETAKVTVVAFVPEESGIYTITVGDDALIANCGGSSAYIYDWANVTPGTSLEWTCQTVGQPLMLGIKSDSDSVAVTVERSGDYTETVINEVVYQNTATGTLAAGKPTNTKDPTDPDYVAQLAAYNAAVAALQSEYSSYTLPADAVVGGYVDISTSHTAVLGADGYYHLDSEDGDILLVDLDYIYDMTAVLSSDRPVMYVYEDNDDGSKTRYDISPAVQSYYLLCDENGYYPLTADLIFFYKDYAIGSQAIQSFYLSNYEEDTAWMFACMTMSLPAEAPAVEGSGTDEDPYVLNPNADNHAVVEGDGSSCSIVYFCWTATADGTLTLTFDETDPAPYVCIYVNSLTKTAFQSNANQWTASAELAEGDYVYISIETWNFDSADYTFSASFGSEDDTPVVEGSGTDEDPYVLNPNADNHAVVEGDGSSCSGVYFCWTATADGTLTLIFDENDPAPYVEIYVNSLNKKAFESNANQWTASAELAEGDYVYICIETWDFVSADYTFYASFGSEDDTVEDTSAVLTDGDNSLTIWAGQGTTPYTYIATQSGTLYLTFTYFAYENSWGLDDCTDYIQYYFGMDDWGNENWMKLTINGVMAETYYGSVEVTEGEAIAIGWEFYGANEYVQTNNNLYATLNLNYEGYAFPEPGSIDDPYEMYMSDVDWGYGTTNEVESGASVFYELYNFSGSTVTIKGEGDFTVKVGTYTYDDNWNEILVWTVYTAVDGYVEFYADSYSILVEIVNNSDAAAAYEVGYYYPLGHTYNPQIITGEGQWTVSLDANSNGYYFQWTLGDDGKTGIMTITVGGESWEYYVSNDSLYEYGDTHAKGNDGIATEAWTVFAGNVFTFCVTTEGSYDENWNYTCPAGEITVTVTFKEQELVQGVDYPYVVSYYDVLPAEITVGAGKNVWVELDYFSGYYVVIKGEGASLTYNDVVYTDEDGDGTLMVAISDYTANVTLGNTSDADVTYFISYEAPLGHSENPQSITDDGIYTSSEFTANGLYNYYFKYTATENGTITVKVLNEGGWRCYIQNKATYASAGGNSTYVDSTITMKVNAGDTVMIYGAPYENYTVIDGVLSFEFSFEKEVLDTDNATSLADGNNAVELDNMDTQQTTAIYTYTATQSGTLYLTLSNLYYYTYSSYSGTVNGPYAGRDYLSRYTYFLVNGEALSGGYYGTVEVEKGDVITITWNMKYNYAWKFEANLNLSYEGYNPAPGSEADPIQVSFSECYQVPVQTIEIAAGSTVYYILSGFDGYFLTITGEGAYLIYNGVTYTAENGVIELVGDAYEMTVQIGNSGDSAATFEISGAFPVGNQMNPEKITEGEHSVTVDANDENYFVSYTPDCDGIMTITVSGDSWTFMIYNATTGMGYYDGEWSYWGGWYYSSDYDTNTITIEIEVWAGEEIQIGVNTEYASDDPEGLYGSSPAGTISLTVANEFFHEDEDEDGYCDICNTDLNETTPDQPTVLYGDLNGDGEIDLRDANLIVGYYNGTVDLTEEQLLAADVSGDGEVDLRDANQIVGYYNGTVDGFNAGQN